MSDNNGVTVIKHDSRKLIMREHVGDFGSEETEIRGTLSNTLGRAPIIEFENGDLVIFDWNWLINRALDALEDHDKKENEDE